MWPAVLAWSAFASGQDVAEVLVKVETIEQALADSNVLNMELATKIEDLEKALADSNSLNTPLWMLLCGVLVMFMQAGFAMLEAGCARNKNVQSVLMKNMIDICVGTLGWLSVGWSFAYVGVNGSFLGGSGEYFLADVAVWNDQDGSNIVPADGTFTTWFFQWAFCATAATIVSGGVMERVNFWAYLIYVVVMTTLIYPVVVANTWGGGVINEIFLGESGFGAYIDFAGSGVVHLTGGVGALVGAAVLGPRTGRFDEAVDQSQFDPHSMTLVTLGPREGYPYFGESFFLYSDIVDGYGFNCGSTLAFDSKDVANLAGMVACNTTISAAASGAIVVVLSAILPGFQRAKVVKLDLGHLCNGVLAGLVSITAGCGNVQPYSAMMIGLIGGMFYLFADKLLVKLKIDDPLSAFSVHGACGMWGVLAAALFDFGAGLDTFHGWNGWAIHTNDGSNTTVGEALAANLAEIGFIWAWCGSISFVVFFSLKWFGLLRVSVADELAGLDSCQQAQQKAHRFEEAIADNAVAEANPAKSRGAVNSAERV